MSLPEINRTADSLRQLHDLPRFEEVISTLGRALVDKYGTLAIDAQKLVAGDAAHRLAVRLLLGLGVDQSVASSFSSRQASVNAALGLSYSDGSAVVTAPYVKLYHGTGVTNYAPAADTDIARGAALTLAIAAYVAGDVIRINGAFNGGFSLTNGNVVLEGTGPETTRLYHSTVSVDTGATLYVSDDAAPMSLIELRSLTIESNNLLAEAALYIIFADANSSNGRIVLDRIVTKGDATTTQTTYYSGVGLSDHTCKIRNSTFINTAPYAPQNAAVYFDDAHNYDIADSVAISSNVGWDLSNGSGLIENCLSVVTGETARGFRFDGGYHLVRNCEIQVTGTTGTSSCVIIPTTANVRLQGCRLTVTGSGTLRTTTNAAGTVRLADTAFDPTLTSGTYSIVADTPLRTGESQRFTASVGNVTTGETDLFSYTVPGFSLPMNADALDLQAGGLFVLHATATRQLKVKFAGTTVLDGGALTSAANSSWQIVCTIVRTSTTTARVVATLQAPGASTTLVTTQTDLTGLDFSVGNILKLTGQAGATGAATNAIVAKLGVITKTA
jgi:hypothetical protein